MLVIVDNSETRHPSEQYLFFFFNLVVTVFISDSRILKSDSKYGCTRP